MKYQNYIFDLYGTLVDIRTDEWSAQLWKKMAILYGYYGAQYTYKELGKAYGELVAKEKRAARRRHPEYTVVDIKIEKVFRALFTRKGVKPKKATVLEFCEVFRCFSTKFLKLYDGVTELLDAIKSNGGRISLLSNAQRTFTENELNSLGLTRYFDGICISSDEECSKPDSHYFQILFDRYGLKKEESVMIGNDCLADIGGAADFGIDSLYIHQAISPEVEGKLRSNYAVMDGDVYKIISYLFG